MTGSEVREKFLKFFENKKHTLVKSSSLVPANDPTLLFTNAGMVPFKDLFLGGRKPYPRATSSQKCLRVSGKHNDLETVGRTARHHTFFEMLGNFSFGDYFKEDAIQFAWEFIVDEMKIPEEKLVATVFTDDDEAALIWEKKIGLPKERIVRCGEKDNFWSMGDTGPCGPCSEIHYDRGEAFSCGNPDCGVDCECDRFLEIWNLVFMQYNRDKAGALNPLPNPSIDTGMGLERLVSLVQGVETNFETDLILPVIRRMEKFANEPYRSSAETDVSYRVIGDHMRAVTFLIADDIHPSNEGRGYVLRRILRRALRHGRMLGVKDPFAHKLTDTVIEVMKDGYPELSDYSEIIRGVTLGEERSFSATLEYGMAMISDMIKTTQSAGEKTLSGDNAFKLYDTYGFPIDLATDIAGDAGLDIDTARFDTLMNEQKVKARASWKGGGDSEINPTIAKATAGQPATVFTGYEEDSTESTVLAIICNGDIVDSISEGSAATVLLNKTPFYAESGGQVSDTGIVSGETFRVEVTDVSKPDGEHFLHEIKVTSGNLRVGDKVASKINYGRRNAIRKNHSATHLLHSALRQALGGHVKQGGSQVDEGRLRFDYTHFTSPSSEEINRVESVVNEKIMANMAVTTDVMDIKDAAKSGAMALFGEKYGEKVRVVGMGDFSKELCGGCHANATGDIGFFKIVSEGAVSAGVRRIEAVTGQSAFAHVKEAEDQLKTLGEVLKSSGGGLADKAKKLLERIKELEKENRSLKEKLFTGGGRADDSVTEIAGVKTVVRELDGADAEALRSFIDDQKNRLGSAVIAVAAGRDGKALIAIGVTNDLVKRFHAGKMIKKAAGLLGGGGGGRPDFAQAGGKNPENIKIALDAVLTMVKEGSGE